MTNARTALRDPGVSPREADPDQAASDQAASTSSSRGDSTTGIVRTSERT